MTFMRMEMNCGYILELIVRMMEDDMKLSIVEYD